MTITNDDLCQFTRAIWESTLGLEVRPIAAPSLPEQGPCTLVGKVQITGAWLGTVLLECPEKLAKMVARIMFGLDSEEPTPEEVRDALAEMTNMTAGNFKSLVCGRCHLSALQVSEGAPDLVVAPKNPPVFRQTFLCQGEPFVVSLLEG
jgi:hypothetical protein